MSDEELKALYVALVDASQVLASETRSFANTLREITAILKQMDNRVGMAMTEFNQAMIEAGLLGDAMAVKNEKS